MEPTLRTVERQAPCEAACPAGLNVKRYIQFIAEEKYDEALCVIREKIPFPSVCGYVCPHPCEGACILGDLGDPIAIRGLKRYVAERNSDLWKSGIKIQPESGRRVAIIGSGPAGLTAAYFLCLLGHSVTVFEAMAEPGGMMKVGIPRYRLPGEVLEREIHEIEQLGVEIKTGIKIDSLDTLLEGTYDAVLLAIGCHQGIKLPLTDSELKNVLVGTSFLRGVNLGEKPKLGNRVVVLGGGNVAIDCARTSVRLGSEDVHIVCIEPEEKMLASPEEVRQSKEEGINIHNSQAFVHCLRDADSVSGIECMEVESYRFDEKDGLKFETVSGSEKILPADSIIFAIGQLPDLELLSGIKSVGITFAKTIEVDHETMFTGHKGVFAAGDGVTGTASVIEAIAAGRKAAKFIDIYLGGKGNIDQDLVPMRSREGYAISELCLNRIVQENMTSVSERRATFGVVELGFNEVDAIVEEARRCLRCGSAVEYDSSKCAFCHSCQVWCSGFHEKAFGLEKARLVLAGNVDKDNYKMSFTDDCEGCNLCVKCCVYGALTYSNQTDAQSLNTKEL